MLINIVTWLIENEDSRWEVYMEFYMQQSGHTII